ncbi:DUF1977-containing protein [Aureococcus anophagefferens]|nr:DUF1977-containing protein [Aureococcus anophagefferens]
MAVSMRARVDRLLTDIDVDKVGTLAADVKALAASLSIRYDGVGPTVSALEMETYGSEVAADAPAGDGLEARSVKELKAEALARGASLVGGDPRRCAWRRARRSGAGASGEGGEGVARASGEGGEGVARARTGGEGGVARPRQRGGGKGASARARGEGGVARARAGGEGGKMSPAPAPAPAAKASPAPAPAPAAAASPAPAAAPPAPAPASGAVKRLTKQMIARVLQSGSHYDVLGIEVEATDRDVKVAYRDLAILVHPDKCSEKGAAEAFKKVNEAKKVLGDSERRDLRRRAGRRAAKSAEARVESRIAMPKRKLIKAGDAVKEEKTAADESVPMFDALTAAEQAADDEPEYRKVRIPSHRYTPLRKSWP